MIWLRSHFWLSTGVTALFLSSLATPALAQFISTPIGINPIRLDPIPEAFKRALTFSSQDAFSTTFTTGRQIDFLFGLGGFPEVELNRDISLVHKMYEDVLRQQYSSGPILRSPDLQNPYNSSLRTNPLYTQPGQASPGGEFVLPRPFLP
ncbi:hypothetical protein K4A83_19120 [Spirulina subsalsa FACHB-351]|uniref:Uncharacterized protein n=1 Tax=Spirulina subsalsa FACHB-351 TaxID=234711 RepID=A0ABT3LA30_9CYAN|nr:hypothetical protein [Spirulina subsalsa]MCW6038368.1 hypothetical protein [Spirulina subsalsa FACHB-351]